MFKKVKNTIYPNIYTGTFHPLKLSKRKALATIPIKIITPTEPISIKTLWPRLSLKGAFPLIRILSLFFTRRNIISGTCFQS